MPLTQDVSFLFYSGFADDGDEEVQGFLFYYHDHGVCYSVEQTLVKATVHEQRDKWEDFGDTVCKVLFAVDTGKNWSIVPKQAYMAYQGRSSLDFILKQQDLNTLLRAD